VLYTRRVLGRAVVVVAVVDAVVVDGMSRESVAYESINYVLLLRSIPRVYEVQDTYQCDCHQVATVKMYKYNIHCMFLSSISLGTTGWRRRR